MENVKEELRNEIAFHEGYAFEGKDLFQALSKKPQELYSVHDKEKTFSTHKEYIDHERDRIIMRMEQEEDEQDILVERYRLGLLQAISETLELIEKEQKTGK